MIDYKTTVIIKYLGRKGYRVTSTTPGRRRSVYIANTFSDAIREGARALKDISKDLDVYAEALEDKGVYASNIAKDLGL